jgi:hypothetical protein
VRSLDNPNSLSAIALSELLRRVIQSPSGFAADTLLVEALRSQGALAKYERRSESIVPSSINTLKKWAAEQLDGGWDALDHLRKGAKEALLQSAQRQRGSSKSTKAGLLARTSKLEANLLEQRRVNLGLLHVLGTLCADIQNIARLSNGRDRLALSEESLARLRASLALNVPPFDKLAETRTDSAVARDC